jgi:saccharopine dehydrogenase-like NADP-dependent oxidoreductase
VVILNEVGLDPGIDHLLIMKSIDEIHARGGTVTELVSLCGGLPDPVAADNPLRYKMSWSPKVRRFLNSTSYMCLLFNGAFLCTIQTKSPQ